MVFWIHVDGRSLGEVATQCCMVRSSAYRFVYQGTQAVVLYCAKQSAKESTCFSADSCSERLLRGSLTFAPQPSFDECSVGQPNPPRVRGLRIRFSATPPNLQQNDYTRARLPLEVSGFYLPFVQVDLQSSSAHQIFAPMVGQCYHGPSTMSIAKCSSVGV